MKFPPINLWSKPYQEQFDEEFQKILDEIFILNTSVEARNKIITGKIIKASERLKELSFLHYIRTGRHLIK